MGLLSKFTKSGAAKRAVDEARKPHNQRRIKDALSKLGNRGGPRNTHPER